MLLPRDPEAERCQSAATVSFRSGLDIPVNSLLAARNGPGFLAQERSTWACSAVRVVKQRDLRPRDTRAPRELRFDQKVLSGAAAFASLDLF